MIRNRVLISASTMVVLLSITCHNHHDTTHELKSVDNALIIDTDMGLDDVRALIGHLGRGEFTRLVGGARLESARTRAFWRHMLEKEGVACTREFSREEAANCWRGSSH